LRASYGDHLAAFDECLNPPQTGGELDEKSASATWAGAHRQLLALLDDLASADVRSAADGQAANDGNLYLQPWEKIASFSVAVVFLGLIAYVGARSQPIASDRQFFLLRLVAALMAAAFAGTLAGFLRIVIRGGRLLAVRAGGAFAAFAVVFLINPPHLAESNTGVSERGTASPSARQDAAPGQLGGRSFWRAYYQGFEASPQADSTRYADIWQLGTSGDWTGKVADGKYHLCNSSGNATASYTNRVSALGDDGQPVDLSDSQVTVRVRVEPPAATYSGAGILFRANGGATRYVAFVLNAGPGVSLLKKHQNKVKILWSAGIDPHGEEAVELSVEGEGDSVKLFVDGNLVHSESGLGELHGDVGLMAYSTGCFVVDDFALYRPR